MAPLSKLTLTKFERSQTHQDPVLDRRAKALNALAQQRDVLNAVWLCCTKGPEFGAPLTPDGFSLRRRYAVCQEL